MNEQNTVLPGGAGGRSETAVEEAEPVKPESGPVNSSESESSDLPDSHKARKKKKKAWRIVKICLITFFSLILLLTGIVAFLINFIFTPEKVTPVVERIASDYLDAEVKIGSVELTFFSTYPRVALDVKDGLVVSHALKDSCFDKTDTLISFKDCRVKANLGAYLARQRVVVRNITIDSARMYLFTDKNGVSNYDIFKESDAGESDSLLMAASMAGADSAALMADSVLSDTVNGADADSAASDTVVSDTAASPVIRGIHVRSLILNDAYVYFDDRSNRVYGRVEGADLRARLSLSKPVSRLKLDFSNDNVLFWQDDELLVNKVSLGIKTNLDINRDSLVCHLNKAVVKVNDIGFAARGNFRVDTAQHGIAMDLGFGLRTPSLKDVLSMIPESVLAKSDVDAEGEVSLGGKLHGIYGKGKMPEASLKIRIKNGSAHYAGMPYGIDTLTADFDAFVDMSKRKDSYADLKIFRLKAMDVDVLASCKVEHLLTEPVVSLSTNTNVDLSVLHKIFPLQPGVAMGGVLDADLKGHFKLEDIRNENYGKIQMKGTLGLDRIYLNDTAKDFYSKANATFKFQGDRYLGANFTIHKLLWNGKHIKAYMDTLRVRALTVPPKDSGHIALLTADIKFKKVFAKLADTLFFFNTHTEAKATLKPHPKNPKRAYALFDFETDTIYARSGQAEAKLRKGTVHVDLTHLKDSIWYPKANVDFRRAVFIVPDFAQPLRFNRLKAKVDGGNVDIQRANLRMGRSQLTIKGSFKKLFKVFYMGETLKADITLKSKMLDCNQLINSISRPVDTSLQNLNEMTAAEEAAQDALDDALETASVQDTLMEDIALFLVPDKLDLELKLDAKKVIYDKMLFENIKGDAVLRNRAVNLRELDLEAMGASMKLSMVYATPSPKQADAGFDLDIHDIQIEKLIEFIPSLDSTLPMLRSFQGTVDVQTEISSRLDSTMTIVLPSLTAALRLHGEQLVLLDGETFAEISKLLMFKNKERNMIDSISAVVTVQDGEVTVYPFMIEIDRYKVAVGGHQDLAMNFDYHISVLKSPLPFRLGVNVRGNMDKMKIGLGKVLYKDSFTPAAVKAVDSARLDLGRQIVNQFEGWMNRERRVIRRVDFPVVPRGEDSAAVEEKAR